MKRTRLLLSALFLCGIASATQAQDCLNCQNIAPDGDMSDITTSGQGSLNTMGINWHSSHGSPSYSPGSLWMWSYDNYGEGVYYDGLTYQAGHTYCITFDTYTRTNDNSTANPAAGFRVVGSNGVVPYETGSGGSSIPAIPSGSDIVADVNWNTTPMNGWSTYSFMYTPSVNQSQLWFYPYSPTLPQVELTLQNLRVCDVTTPNPCDFDLDFDPQPLPGGCGYQFYANVGLPSGLTVIQYLWDFGDGTTSTSINPIHYYSTPGGYVVKLTVLVINDDGQCCARVYQRDVQASVCDPCELIKNTDFTVVRDGGTTATFTAGGPASPNYVYMWTFGDGGTATGQTVTHTYPAYGIYGVHLRIYYFDADQGICCSGDVIKKVKIIQQASPTDPTGPINPTDPATPIGGLGEATVPRPADAPKVDIAEYLKERPGTNVTVENAVAVFPNPTSGAFTVTSTIDKILQVQVLDAQGRVIQSVKTDKKSVTISLQEQKTGTYTLNVELENGKKHTQTIVKN